MRYSSETLSVRQLEVLRLAIAQGDRWWPARVIGGKEYSHHSRTLQCLLTRGLIERRRRNTPNANTRNAWLYRITAQGTVLATVGSSPPIDHGHARAGAVSPTYRSWKSMLDRCRLPSAQSYRHYGRGITVCGEWLVFDSFLRDMGERPVGTTLDRIDVNGNYELENCRWADAETQGSNRSNNRRIVLDGESLTMAQWERRMGLPKGCVFRRLDRGWSEERSVRERYHPESDHRSGDGPGERQAVDAVFRFGEVVGA